MRLGKGTPGGSGVTEIVSKFVSSGPLTSNPTPVDHHSLTPPSCLHVIQVINQTQVCEGRRTATTTAAQQQTEVLDHTPAPAAEVVVAPAAPPAYPPPPPALGRPRLVILGSGVDGVRKQGVDDRAPVLLDKVLTTVHLSCWIRCGRPCTCPAG